MSKPVVLITGGSRGIGAATAKRFSRAGYFVVVNFRSDQSAANELKKSIQQSGGDVLLVQSDVSEEEGTKFLFQELDGLTSRLDVLVNNAGVLDQQCTIDGITQQRMQRLFSTNVFGTMLCAREAVKRMKNRGAGSIVNVSSGAARTGSPNEYLDYAASKGAVDTFTVGLAKEIAQFGIRVNGVRPGLIYTEMHSDGGEPGRVDRLKEKIPLTRGGKPEEVAEAIYWLASEQASFSTGSILDVTGGM